MKSKIENISFKLRETCKIYGREASGVNLVAVSKSSSSEKIIEAIASGCKIFGENYVKEAKEKWLEIKKNFPEIQLHFIGHLQSNKAAEVVELFDCIQTVDSKKLALVIKKEVQKQRKNPEIFIQVNVGEEVQKSGIAPSEVEDFVKFCRDECELNVSGLMGVPPSNEEASPYFAFLVKLAEKNNLKNLSMGMSSDFEEAVALGATHVRIGSTIFG